MYPKSLYNVRSINNLKHMIEQSENLFGDKTAFLVKSSRDAYKEISFRQFKNDIDALGTAFIDLGLKDEFIAVIGENRYEWCVTHLATINGTGVIIPLDKDLPLAEIENLLVRSKASAIVFSSKYKTKMKQLSLRLSSVKYFISMDTSDNEQDFLSYKQLVNWGYQLLNSGEHSFTDAQIDATAFRILLFTSGTTDLAKGVMLSHRNICADIMSVCSSIYVDSTDSVLSILPLHHTYECTCGFLLMVYNGCTISFNEGLKYIAKNLQEVKPSILLSVPLILENMYKKIWEQAAKKNNGKTKLKLAMKISDVLYNSFKIDLRKKLFKEIHDNIGGRIRLIISGAAGINPTVSKDFRSLGILILQGYGLTECSPIVTVNIESCFGHGSIGLPLPNVEVKVEGTDSDGIGELVVKGDNIMLGYFENDLATEMCLKNGWFHTGDLGYMDKSNLFYITGRRKNVIVTKNGKKVFPEEVEAYLNDSPYILESLVSGISDSDSGETFVNAQIVPDYDTIREELKVITPSDDEVFSIINSEVKIINKNMPLYKMIRQFTIRQDEFAKTTTKKIKRYVDKLG